MDNPNLIIVKRNWYSDNDEFIKQCKETYEFTYSYLDDFWFCDYEKFIEYSDKPYYEKKGPFGIAVYFFKKFIKDLLKLNGKKRKRKNGYTKYEVSIE